MYLEQFSFDSPKLFIFFLGGSVAKSHIEMHDVVFIVAKSDVEATEKIKKKWCGTKKSCHVDSWFAAEELDEFAIKVSIEKPPESNSHLYFVDLGYYKTGVFGELHFLTLVVANSKMKAVEEAKKKCNRETEMLHTDNICDIDGCIRIDEVDHYFIELEYTGLQKEPPMPMNGYQKLRPLVGGMTPSPTSVETAHILKGKV